MPRKRKAHLFGIFDEQAVSILAVLMIGTTTFGELVEHTGLSKASLSRALKELEGAKLVERRPSGYAENNRGKRIVRLVLQLAQEDSKKTVAAVGRRLSQMEAEYQTNRRLFHSDAKWERTAEKPLVEVMAVRRQMGVESLLFQQRFLKEVTREEEKLRHSKVE
jgi:DNA-binding MarR family transcriptional regulator